jgi:predicted glycosyltransferase
MDWAYGSKNSTGLTVEEKTHRSWSRRSPRVLLYSHDTFGLGHLRRSRAVAHALIKERPDLSILIVSGSPIIGNFDFGDGIDYVRIPGVTKLPSGEYSTLNLNLEIDEATALRASIIRQTAETFDPDIFIVDKEPTGFRGEVIDTLVTLKRRGCPLVLGLRDVMDEPSLLIPEWQRKNAIDSLERLYDEIWIYGLKDIYNPLSGFQLTSEVEEKIRYTGYLKRSMPSEPTIANWPEVTEKDFILVTTGGGGDGYDLIDWVLSAYETDETLDVPSLLVLGPFMQSDLHSQLMTRIDKLEHVHAMVFDAKIEYLEEKAVGVVAMGGYNTFCEILSLDKRAIIVPRTAPRLEQYIRAFHASRWGLVQMLVDESQRGGAARDPMDMAKALKKLPKQKKPSQVTIPGLLDGLSRIKELAAPWLPPKLKDKNSEKTEATYSGNVQPLRRPAR